MADFVMPSLGADMTDGRIVEWHVKPGDEVHRGDIVATVDTSKADIDVEVFEDGVIDAILVAVGEKVAVGTPLAVVRPPGVAAERSAPVKSLAPAAAPAPAKPPAAAPAPAPAQPLGPAPVVAAPPHLHDGGRRRVSPVARRMAERLGVELGGLVGTGPHSSICKADVERAAGSAAPASALTAPPVPARAAERARAMRTAIGHLMTRSKREIPHYYLGTDIDLAPATAWLARRNRGRPVAERVVMSAVLLAACARAAARHPGLNGFWVDGAFRPSDRVHLGVAISLREGGLVAPAIHDADRMGVDQLMAALRDLVRRARTGRLRGSEMADPTLTVTNLGDQGVPVVYGVIYAPQVALVGLGAVRERPWADHGLLGVRPIVTATLSADHRVTDGHGGALFLAEIDRLLRAPEEL